MADLQIAIVCSSNQNRSMEAHSCIGKKGFNVRSFGTGNQVKLPGPALSTPNIYDFSITYDEMYKDLYKKNAELYGLEFVECVRYGPGGGERLYNGNGELLFLCDQVLSVIQRYL